MSPAQVTWQLWNRHWCERIPGIPWVDNVHVQKSLGIRLRKDYTICVWKNSCIKFLDVLLYPGHDQVSYAHCFSLNATVACNPQLCTSFRDLHLGIYATCTCKCNLKVAQINFNSYVCIGTHCTLVGSLLILIVYNATTSHQWECNNSQTITLCIHCASCQFSCMDIYKWYM